MQRKIIGKVLSLSGAVNPKLSGVIEIIAGIPADSEGLYEKQHKFTVDEQANIKNSDGGDLFLPCPDTPDTSIQYKLWGINVATFEFYLEYDMGLPIAIQTLRLAGGGDDDITDIDLMYVRIDAALKAQLAAAVAAEVEAQSDSFPRQFPFVNFANQFSPVPIINGYVTFLKLNGEAENIPIA